MSHTPGFGRFQFFFLGRFLLLLEIETSLVVNLWSPRYRLAVGAVYEPFFLIPIEVLGFLGGRAEKPAQYIL